MFNVAVEWGLIPYAPPIKAFNGLPEPSFDFLDFEELDRLVDVATGQYKALIIFAAKTGLRVGEIRALKKDDVDLVAKRVVVRRNIVHGVTDTPKSGKSREVPLCDSVVDALKGSRHLNGPYVFCDSRGNVLNHDVMYRKLAHYCEKAGLRRIGFHTLRHTFASHLAMKGVPMKAIQEMLGHADIKMTMRYSHLSPSVRRQLELPSDDN